MNLRNLLKKFIHLNVLYYPGCLTRFVATDLLENYRKIFKSYAIRDLSIDFIELEEANCCGSPVLKAGYTKDFKDLAKKNLRMFKEYSVGMIVTSCPACAATLREEYKRVLGDDWDIEVKHMLEVIDVNEQEDPRGIVTYHDPCHLGKKLGIYDQPREVIKKLGYEIKEMDLNRKNSFCCGGGGGLSANNPELSSEIAKKRLSMAKEIKVPKLVTSCPLCYLHLKDNSKDIDVVEISQLFK